MHTGRPASVREGRLDRVLAAALLLRRSDRLRPSAVLGEQHVPLSAGARRGRLSKPRKAYHTLLSVHTVRAVRAGAALLLAQRVLVHAHHRLDRLHEQAARSDRAQQAHPPVGQQLQGPQAQEQAPLPAQCGLGGACLSVDFVDGQRGIGRRRQRLRQGEPLAHPRGRPSELRHQLKGSRLGRREDSTNRPEQSRRAATAKRRGGRVRVELVAARLPRLVQEHGAHICRGGKAQALELARRSPSEDARELD